MGEVFRSANSLDNLDYKSSFALCSYIREVDKNKLAPGNGYIVWEAGDVKSYGGYCVNDVKEAKLPRPSKTATPFFGTFKEIHYDKGRYIIKADD